MNLCTIETCDSRMNFFLSFRYHTVTSIIVMAGIAAEAQKYGKAEGGASDEQAITQLLFAVAAGAGSGRRSSSASKFGAIEGIRDQARWGVVQASLLLTEHKDSFEALVACLDRGDKLGDCIMAIERALPRDNETGLPLIPALERLKQHAILERSWGVPTAASKVLQTPPQSNPGSLVHRRT